MVRIHDLRYPTALTMLSEGSPIKRVAQVLGHNNISGTRSTYGRHVPDRMQDTEIILDFTSLKMELR
ncbi:tyrosine-type recombinase/integrase [Paracoccus isoporae]|uniref:tyrosine-type recombinase/integrase n=1 Tax=Paracoccus isoporae TaxID=591205 RepID=UPI000B83DB7E